MFSFRFLLSSKLLFVITTCSLSAQWVEMNGPIGAQTTCFASSGTNLFTATYGAGVFLSTNNGMSWTIVLPKIVNTLAVSGQRIFAGTDREGVHISTDNGASWVVANSGLTSLDVRTFAFSGNNIFVGTYGGVFLSTNNGANWIGVNNGLTNPLVNTLAISGTNIYAGTFLGGVFLSTNSGSTWSEVNSGLASKMVNALTVFGNNLYAGTDGGGVFLSSNAGTSWNAVSIGIPNARIYAFASYSSNLFVGTLRNGVFLSTNNGKDWNTVNTGLTYLDVQALEISGAYIFAGTSPVGVWRRPLSELITSAESTPSPDVFKLEQNYPNPIHSGNNTVTTIKFQIPSTSAVTLKVYNTLGMEVATLVDEVKNPGSYDAPFDASGLSSGLYFYRLQAGSFTETKKLILLK